MEVFFNELSCHPFAANSPAAKSKIITLLETLKQLRKDSFNIMRASNNFYSLEIAPDYYFTNFFSDPSISRDLKTLFKGVVKAPYIEDDTSYEAEIFILSDFETQNHEGDDVSPEGLASAFVYSSPTVSLTGHSHWQRDLIPIIITSDDDKDNPITENIHNVYSATSVAGKPFIDWLQSLTDGIQLNNEKNILLVFPADRFEFEARAMRELISWYYDDKRFIIKIKNLINDIVPHPFKGGLGHTETLGGSEGKASKHIIKKDRLVYTYTKDKITIHQCRGHYDDN